jgi:hypothetical protein
VENLAATSTDVSTALRPDGAGGLQFLDVGHGDLTGVTADQHHAQLHAASHSDGGADEVTVENLATASVDTSTALRPDGAGGLQFADVGHADLTGVTSDQHHAQLHAASHSDGGADEVSVENLATAGGTGTVPTSDGIGGLVMGDHGDLNGLGDDDHTQYSLVDGSRAYTGVVAGVSPVGINDLATKGYVDSTVQGLTWQEPVLDKDLATPPGGPSTGDRYIVAATATGAWTGQEEKIAQWNGSSWDFTTPDEGFATWVEDEDKLYVYNSTHPAGSWVKFGSTLSHDVLQDVSPNDHHNQSHVLATNAGLGADHTMSGASPGDVLRASGPSAANFQPLGHGDLGSVTSDQHHAQTHAASHSDGGADELTVENQATGSVDTSTALRPDGAGGLQFADVGHGDLTGVTADQHHAQTHAASHSDGGADELTVENQATASTNKQDVLKPDGSGGLEFGPVGEINTLSTNDGSVQTIATIPVPDNTVYFVDVWIIGRRTNAADRAGYRKRAVVYREAAGSATLQGGFDSPFTRESAGGWNASVSVSGNNFLVTVKGLVGHNVNWKSRHTIEVVA